MNRSAKPFLICCIMICLKAHAGVGMGDWQCTTPQSNTFDNYSGNGISLSLRNGGFGSVDSLKRWYFYKGFIVGEREHGFFIANEKTAKVQLFATQNTWAKALADAKLKPGYYTRWYNWQWVYYDDIGYYALIFFFMSAPCILIFLYLLYMAFRYEKFNVRKPCTMIVLIVSGLLLITYLLERFPQSI